MNSDNGTFAVIRVDKSAVGHCISTKAVGSDERVDITHLYKYAEGENPHKIMLSVEIFSLTHF